MLILLAVPDEATLTSLSESLTARGVEHVAFVEPDLDDSVTALALFADQRSRRLLGAIPLLGDRRRETGPSDDEEVKNEHRPRN